MSKLNINDEETCFKHAERLTTRQLSKIQLRLEVKIKEEFGWFPCNIVELYMGNSFNYKKTITRIRNCFHCFNNAKLVKKDQFASSTRRYPHRRIMHGCSVQLYFGNGHTTDTFISSAHVPAGKHMTVAVRIIVQYCWKLSSPDQQWFQARGLSKFKDAYVLVLELLNNFQGVGVVQGGDWRCLLHHSLMEHSTSLHSAGPFNNLDCASGYPPYIYWLDYVRLLPLSQNGNFLP